MGTTRPYPLRIVVFLPRERITLLRRRSSAKGFVLISLQKRTSRVGLRRIGPNARMFRRNLFTPCLRPFDKLSVFLLLQWGCDGIH